MPGLAPEVLDEVSKDIAAFADPGTRVQLFPRGQGVDVVWLRNGNELQATLRQVTGALNFPEVLVQHGLLSYPAFLASEYLADLRLLATNIVRTGVTRDFRPGLYVETKAVHDSGTETMEPATSLLHGLATQNLPANATRVVFVHGPAGSGKSWALCKLAYDQAQRYERGESTFLFLYANAQGASLATFDHVLAQALDDFGATFRYHAVAALSRRGCLIVILDGFDELLGSGGYGEAYSSLSNFLARLEGESSLIASARSAFYSYQDFHRAARRYEVAGTLNYQLEPVEICLWGREEARDYFLGFAQNFPGRLQEPGSLYDKLSAAAKGRNRALLEKPFFVAKIAELLGAGVSVDSGRALLPQLLDFFIEREVAKTIGTERRPILSKDQHVELLTELAAEMWWQETGSVDVATLEALGELFGEQWRLSSFDRSVLIAKLPSYGFLAGVGGGERRRAFEHEMYLSFFLARYLRPLVFGRPTELVRFLARGALPESAAAELAGFEPWTSDDVRRVLGALSAVRASRREVARENAGAIAAALLDGRSDLPSGLLLSNLLMRFGRINDAQLSDVEFGECVVQEVDFKGTRFDRLRLRNSVLLAPHVDVSSTRFNETVLHIGKDIVGLLVRGEHREAVYDPMEIAGYLRRMGASTPGYEGELVSQRSELATHCTTLIRRFARLANRQFYVSRYDYRMRQVFEDRQWEIVEALMRRHGMLEEKVISKRGQREALLMLTVDAEDLLRGEDPTADVPESVQSMWRELLAF